MSEESMYPKDWLRLAEDDLARVEKRIEEGDLTDAAFHLQQGVEKYLKAYLLWKGWKLKRIHDLRALLAEAVKYMPELAGFNELCQEITAYYMLERYPLFEEPPKKEELEEALDRAKELTGLLQIK